MKFGRYNGYSLSRLILDCAKKIKSPLCLTWIQHLLELEVSQIILHAFINFIFNKSDDHQKGHQPGQLWQMLMADVASWISLFTCFSTISCSSLNSVPFSLCFTLSNALMAFSLICCLFWSAWMDLRGDSSSTSLWVFI